MKYYVGLISFLAIAAWISCVSISKTQASLPQPGLSLEISSPNSTPTPSPSQQWTEKRMAKPDNRLVKAYNLGKGVKRLSGLDGDLLEVRVMMDTMASLNVETSQIINETSSQLQH